MIWFSCHELNFFLESCATSSPSRFEALEVRPALTSFQHTATLALQHKLNIGPCIRGPCVAVGTTRLTNFALPEAAWSDIKSLGFACSGG